MFRKPIIVLLFLTILFTPSLIRAQDNNQPSQSTQQIESVVTKILEQKEISVEGKKQEYQKLDLLVTKGNTQGKHITVENGNIPIANPLIYHVGDKVIVTISTNPDGTSISYISDYVRRNSLYWLFAIFIILALLIGKERGLTALIGMGISFFIIFNFLLPQILAGQDPKIIVIIASFIIVPITFYISHGLNRKTTAAIIGTLLAVIITAIITGIFVKAAKLTGTASEETAYLTQMNPTAINFQSLLFASILIAVLGVLNDITVSQAAIVTQLKATSHSLTFKELYFKAMSVGKDHIASMINTLILVYVGAFLPLLLLFINSPHPFTEVINYEIVAEEVVRTMVVSIGLILAVPLTTIIACLFLI